MPSAPGNASQRYSTLSLRLIASGQWERALAVARDWLAEEPACVDAHQNAAQALTNLERYPQALEHAQKALAGEPGRPFLHRLASIACFHLSFQARADHHVQEAIRLSPNDAMNWYHLARMRYKYGAYDVAARHARRSLELDPNNADTINLLALCERADPAQQYASYQRALQIDPENAVVHNNLGVYHLNVHRNSDMAAAWFRRALTCDPSDRNAQRNLIVALREGDPFYQFIQFPRRIIAGLGMWQGRGIAGIASKLLVWFYFGHIAILLYGLWLIFGLPFFKGYEWLTLPDVREQAGIVGARRGGWMNFWRWPRWVRVGLFVPGYLSCWAGAIWFVTDKNTSSSEGPWNFILAGGFSLGALVVVCRMLHAWSKSAHRRFVTWRGERRFQRAASASPSPSEV